MNNLSVQWYEGLFLRPQHFQATERWWSEQLHVSQRWDAPHHYGIRSIEFSKEALKNHQFEVKSLQARMRDGTLVNLGDAESIDRLDLKSQHVVAPTAQADLSAAFDQHAVIRIYLALPKLHLGRDNVARHGATNGHAPAAANGNGSRRHGFADQQVRFRDVSVEVKDENRSGVGHEIQFRTLNVQLLLSTQDLSGYELLPIAQIKRASEREAAPQLDEDYIPPVLSVTAWPGLGRDLLRPIFDIIGQKIEVLSEQVRNRGIIRQSVDPSDSDRVAMLERLNEANSALGVLAFTDGVHPLTAFTELCRVVGQLSIFGEKRRVEDLPPYDHEDLGPIFRSLRQRIEQLIFTVRDYEYQQRYFVGVGMGMQVSLDPRWFNSNWQWFIGVKKGDLSEQECRVLLSSGQLDWKLGSSRQVEILFQRRAPGLQLEPLQRTIRALPALSDWLFYEVSRNESPAWRDVQVTQTLAMRLKDSLIVNQDRLQGEQRLVVNTNGRHATLEFALFAVPTQK
jgi:type VI secretion system protein ImpJ